MAFLAEDGTGLEGANSSVDLAFADAYFSERNKVEWTNATPAAKQSSLIAASDYATLRWGNKLSGQKLTKEQGQVFPRLYCYDRDGFLAEGVPDVWKKAICEYAFQHLNDALYPTVSANDTREITQESVTIGPIKTSTTYTEKAPPRFPKADSYARHFVIRRGGVIRN